MKNQFRLDSIADIPSFLEGISPLLEKHKLWFVKGEMGAGKTTIIKAICQQLGATEGLSSPTFAIVNQYETSSGRPIFHFDWYRLRTVDELLDLGWYEYLDSGGYVFVEWPEKAPEAVPDDGVVAEIELLGDHTRLIKLNLPK
ncbi:MAG: tRNA (adenosine(37)-N6)-threonylcarbamoyltransferase complex ATPase subunit type 1 TsaE [Salibacteraceae bacterium]